MLDAFLEHKDCEITAICDIHQPYLDFAAKKIGNNPRQFTDYRRLLDLNDRRTLPVMPKKDVIVKGCTLWEGRCRTAVRFANLKISRRLVQEATKEQPERCAGRLLN